MTWIACAIGSLIITVGTFTAMSRACMLSFRLPESLNRLADRFLLLTPGTVPSQDGLRGVLDRAPCPLPVCCAMCPPLSAYGRSEEHTSELQSRENLVCRLLLEKKKQKSRITIA